APAEAGRDLLLLQLAMDVDQIALRLRGSDARFETADDAQPVIAARVEGVVVGQRQRRPQRDIVRRKPEAARHYAYYCEGFTVEPAGLPTQGRPVAKTSPPQHVAQHHHVMLAVNALFAGEPAPLSRIDAEQRKEVDVHHRADHTLRLIIAGYVVIICVESR